MDPRTARGVTLLPVNKTGFIAPRSFGTHRPRALLIYVISVVVIALLGAALDPSRPDDASIGGLGLSSVVVLLGLPWSLAPFNASDGLDGTLVQALLLSLCAIVNAVLVALAVVAIRRRRQH